MSQLRPTFTIQYILVHVNTISLSTTSVQHELRIIPHVPTRYSFEHDKCYSNYHDTPRKHSRQGNKVKKRECVSTKCYVICILHQAHTVAGTYLAYLDCNRSTLEKRKRFLPSYAHANRGDGRIGAGTTETNAVSGGPLDQPFCATRPRQVGGSVSPAGANECLGSLHIGGVGVSSWWGSGAAQLTQPHAAPVVRTFLPTLPR